MKTQTNTSEPQLVGIRTCLELVFPDPESRPSFRTFNKWMALGYLPLFCIGRRVFLDPQQVRAALDKQFQIHPLAK